MLCWPPALELLELLLLLELEPEDSTQGGTISVLTLLLAGSTSWFIGMLELEALLFDPPPGVSRMVLAGGGMLELELLEELLLDELELELEPVMVGGWHGWIATVSASEPFGIRISLEPGGGVELPLDCVT